MIYNAEDKWNNGAPHLEHRSHKYYMKIGEGANARYFYSPAEYMAYKVGLSKGHAPTADQQMSDLRTRQANRLKAADQAEARRKQAKIENNKGKLQMQKLRNKRADALKARDNNRQAMQDAYNNRRTYGERQKAAADRRKLEARMQSNREAEAAGRRKAAAQSIKAEKARKAEMNKPINRAKRYAKTAYSTAKKTANTAYKSAKKAYNSKQGKAARKKVKRTAQSAYNKGTSFIKKLFNR